MIELAKLIFLNWQFLNRGSKLEFENIFLVNEIPGGWLFF